MATIQANVDFGGPARAGQSVDVYNHGTTTHAPIFGSDGVTALPNPVRVSGNGHVVFQAAAGSYDIVGPDLTRTVVLAATAAPTGTTSAETIETFAASGAAITLGDPLTTGTMKDVTLTANCTITLPAVGAGKSFLLRTTMGGAGGWTVTFVLAGGGSPKWGASGVAPTLTATAGAQDEIAFHSWGTSWTGGLANKDIK